MANKHRVLRQIAVDTAPELDRLIKVCLGDPKQRDELVMFLWDNKVEMLRVMEGYIALSGQFRADP